MTQVEARERSRLWLLALAPVLVAAALRVAIGGLPAFPSDDTYITIHSARHLFESTDPSYPGTPPLAGATSLLHVFTLWLAMRLLPPLWAAEALSWVGAIAFVAGCATLICSRVSSRLSSALLIVLACVVGSTTMQLGNGLETGWAMAAVIWSLHWLATDRPSHWRLPILAGLLPWLRPDLAPLTVMIWWHRFSTARAHRVRDGAPILILGCLGAAIYWSALGSVVPNTVEAKRYFFATYARPLVWRLRIATAILREFALQLGPACVGFFFAARSRTDRLVLIALGVVLAALVVTGPDVLSHSYFRYLHPLAIPLVIVGLADLAEKGHARMKQWRPLPLAAAVIAAATIWSVVQIPQRWLEYRREQLWVVDAQGEISQWLSAHTAPGTSVLVHDVGMISETTTGLRLTDLVGLKTPWVIAVHRELTGPSGGERRSEALHQIACRVDPAFLILRDRWNIDPQLVGGLDRFGWQPRAAFKGSIRLGTVDTPAYTVYRLTISDRCSGVS